MGTFTTHRIGCHDVPLSPVMTYGVVVDGLLEFHALIDAFRLLVRKWPLLSARIGKDGEGQLAYIVPDTLHDDGFTYTTADHTEPLAVYFTVPSATRVPSIHPQTNADLFTPPAHLHHLSTDGYVAHPDQPILHLALSRFADRKTAVGITAPHCFCDAQGMREVWAAWSAVLRHGESAQLGTLKDTLFMERLEGDGQLPQGVTVTDPPAEAHLAADLPATAAPSAAARAKDPGESHWVFFPHSHLRRLKDECNTLLADGGLWVSEGDVLYASWAQTIYADYERGRPGPGKAVAVMFPMDIRRRLPEFDGIFLHNANHFPAASYPTASELVGAPLHRVAADIREAINRSTADEIRRTLAFSRDVYHSTPAHDRSVSTLPPDGHVVAMSNWLSIDFASRETFAPALAAGSGTGDVLWLDISSNAQVGADGWFGIAPRRDEEGVWVWFTLAPETWTRGAVGEMLHV